MSETTLSVSLPLDSDGFLRRECPLCEQQFKWLSSDESESAAEYFCPYCGRAAAADQWWTKEQLEYLSAEASARVVAPQMEQMARQFNAGQRSNSFIKLSLDVQTPSRPAKLVEPDDMRRVSFQCHPAEPVKVAEDWRGSLSCLVCGAAVPSE